MTEIEEGSSNAAVSNKEFLDTYLEFGIGHYYTLAKLLCNRISGDLSEAETHSVGLEVSALAIAALDNLVTWYYTLGQWRPLENDGLLVDILDGVLVEDSLRLDVLRHVRDTRTDEFCYDFRIPWKREELRARGIDVVNWLYTVDQAKLNITKVLEDLAPSRITTNRAWITRYLNQTKHSPLVGEGSHEGIPAVRMSSSAKEVSGEDGENDLPAPARDSEIINRLADLTGNAAIGLFCLVRLLYVTAFGREPRSPSFVVIWQELHPARGAGP